MKIRNIFYTALIILGLIIVSCGDTYNIDGLGVEATGARIKFVQSCSNCPLVHLKVGGKLVTGAGLGYNGVFPGVGYTAFPAGEVNYEFVRADSGQVVFSGKIPTTADKYYTVFLNDTLPTQSSFFTEDNIQSEKNDTMARIRFVNGLSGKIKDTLEVVRKTGGVIVSPKLAFNNASTFIVNQGNTPDSFYFRKSGTSTAYPGFGAAIGTWTKGRTFTVYSRGVISKTGVQAPGVTIYSNL